MTTNRIRIRLLTLLSTVVLAACGGAPEGAPQATVPATAAEPLSMAEAFQFLNQATFGATEGEARNVIDLGIAGWIDAQMQMPPSHQLPFLRASAAGQQPFELHDERLDIWFRNTVNGNDQLRQRLAFALSEIFVVSQFGALGVYPYALADYYDMLVDNAFGNYRQLLREVTLHPAMGIYLSILGNEKPDTARNIRPDENYARELMQLFSIGLVELEMDGTPLLDENNQPIPTYDQSVIEGFAHVFTGWHFAGVRDFRRAFPDPRNQTEPMQLYEEFHDTGSKLLLRGETIPAGQSGEQDLAQALDNIFNHPNVAPFIATRLIQRLVTSNPSPGYVERVAAVFADNGAGVRGDLGAVVRRILLDPDARSDLPNELDGKVKEPLLRLTQLWRAYDATSSSGSFSALPANFFLGQGPLQSPSVFNFFSPFYAPPGEIRNSSLVAPELQIATEFQNALLTNYFLFQTLGLTSEADDLDADDIYIVIDEEMALANDTEALVNRVADKLLAGEISQVLLDETRAVVARIPADAAALRVGEAIYFIVSSPEYAYQR
jgi:uncharacterized protein (DUF1800 family)